MNQFTLIGLTFLLLAACKSQPDARQTPPPEKSAPESESAVSADSDAQSQQPPAAEKTKPGSSCDALAGTRFVSVDTYETGMGPMGEAAMGRWSVTFEEGGRFTWLHSDIAESGTYRCDEGRIATGDDEKAPSGEYNAEEQKLEWEGKAYVPADQIEDE